MAVRKNDALALADELCKAYLAAALKRKSLDDAVPPCMANACQTGRPADVFKQLSKLADAFEDQRTDTFQDVLRRLRFTPRNAYTNFVSVAQSLFQDGIHWGRIVGLYVLGGAVAVECARRNMRGYVELVRGWFMTYVTENLLEWITEHGGWVSGESPG